ncbi:MAG: hypothetical protein ACLP6G_03890, partial [Terriglobales bacterium]
MFFDAPRRACAAHALGGLRLSFVEGNKKREAPALSHRTRQGRGTLNHLTGTQKKAGSSTRP